MQAYRFLLLVVDAWTLYIFFLDLTMNLYKEKENHAFLLRLWKCYIIMNNKYCTIMEYIF